MKEKMVNNSKEALSIIKKTANQFLPGCKVLLFGSRARNENAVESDYDILIVIKETIDIRKKRILKSQLRKELAHFKIPADIIIQSKNEIQTNKNISGHIIRQVIDESISI